MRSSVAWRAAAVAFLALGTEAATAQLSLPVNLTIGSGLAQVGVQRAPNQACLGPTAITAAREGAIAVLDALNQKVLVVGPGGTTDVPIPQHVVEPNDVLVTRYGYLIVGGAGEIVHVDQAGAVLTSTRVDHSPEDGQLRFSRTSDGRLAVETLTGAKLVVTGLDLQVDDLVSPGLVADGVFSQALQGPTSLTASSQLGFGATVILRTTTSLRIAASRVTWAEPQNGGILATQLIQRLPEDATFIRLSRFDGLGRLNGEAYLEADTFACDARRPYTRLTDGRIVGMSFVSRDIVTLREININQQSATPKPVTTGASATLISDETGDALSSLERLNGTPSALGVGMSSVTTESILQRARAALAFKWTLNDKNYANEDIPNICEPPTRIWKRPQRLDGKVGQEVTAPPYRWGGYVRTMSELFAGLASGRLAGSVCTCRNANCVQPKAIGQDCSGFVSYAWNAGNYYTTRSLANPRISGSITWSNLAPGDIVNSAGSHVRLVEKIRSGPQGRVITVIESTTKRICGGVCRQSYLESELVSQGYKPYRRTNLQK